MAKNLRLEAQQRSDRKWVDELIASAQRRGWFGTITLEMKKGVINLVGCLETKKPPRIGDTPEEGKKS